LPGRKGAEDSGLLVAVNLRLVVFVTPVDWGAKPISNDVVLHDSMMREGKPKKNGVIWTYKVENLIGKWRV